MTRSVSLVALALMLAMTNVSAAAAATHAEAADHAYHARLTDLAAELRKRRISPPKMGARHRSALNARIASIDEALEVLASDGRLSAERVAQLFGEAPTRTTGSDERIARIEARLERSPKLGTLERKRLENQLAAVRADDTRVAASTSVGRTLELERATLERRLTSGPRLGQRERGRMRERIDEIDSRLAALEREANRLQVTESD